MPFGLELLHDLNLSNTKHVPPAFSFGSGERIILTGDGLFCWAKHSSSNRERDEG